jgi:hypothetical protein
MPGEGKAQALRICRGVPYAWSMRAAYRKEARATAIAKASAEIAALTV